MAKYYKEISHLLALGAESFEEELKKIVSNLFYNQRPRFLTTKLTF